MIDCFQSASNPVSASVEDSSNKRIKTETDTCSKFNDLEKNEFYQGKRLNSTIFFKEDPMSIMRLRLD